MKREFIKGLLPDISDDILKQIMDEHSRDIGEYKTKVTALETERDGLKTQLSDANTAIQSYKDMDIDGIKQKASEWETKYNTDTQALQDKLDAQTCPMKHRSAPSVRTESTDFVHRLARNRPVQCVDISLL